MGFPAATLNKHIKKLENNRNIPVKRNCMGQKPSGDPFLLGITKDKIS
jgi:hypothetical protein